MFKVLLTVIYMGVTQYGASVKAFDTLEECDAWRPGSVERFKVLYPAFEVKESKCVPADEADKAATSNGR